MNSQTFELHAEFKPSGDQPNAIRLLIEGIQQGLAHQTLLGVTGSGKTFTMANVIQTMGRPTLILAPNKTLAAQLYGEMKEFFPKNAVEYFVSYYDYYQPEAYIAHSDTYIEKEAQVNEEIDRLRHACTQALISRRDVIIVASVSAIYGLGSPAEYEQIVLHLRQGQELDRRAFTEQLISMQFERTTSDLRRGTFRLRGQVLEIMPVNEEMIYRLEISNRIDLIERVDPVTRQLQRAVEDMWLFPAKHYVVGEAARRDAFTRIDQELTEQLAVFERQGKLLEYERLKRRVRYDLEMIKEIGYCNGIENYSRQFEGRAEGEPPFTLLDYFKYSADKTTPSSPPSQGGEDRGVRSTRLSVVDTGLVIVTPPLGGGARGGFLTIIDESHVTLPQIRGMYNGDRARKDVLVEHGFRLPSARDNRPLRYEEFEKRIEQVVYVSATPTPYEISESQQVVEQVVRPTGLIDPEVIIRPITPNKEQGAWNKEQTSDLSVAQGTATQPNLPLERGGSGLSQVEDLLIRIRERIASGERALVTTLTKKMAEDLTDYLKEQHLKVSYLHSDVDTLERIQVITDLRLGKVDVIIGVNLLREGLDIPEVSLVAILDADKEGFLRSETSLVQTIGRAARNVNGQVVLYADSMTGSMERALAETDRRRKIQLAYNEQHGITPKTIQKAIRNILAELGISEKKQGTRSKEQRRRRSEVANLDILGDNRPLVEIIKDKTRQMKEAAQGLDFEVAAILRDEVRELTARSQMEGKTEKASKNKKSASKKNTSEG